MNKDHFTATAARIGDGLDYQKLLPAQVLAAHKAQKQMDGIRSAGLVERGYKDNMRLIKMTKGMV
jgi:hypothetical protein